VEEVIWLVYQISESHRPTGREMSRLAAGAVSPNLKCCKDKISFKRILDSKVGSSDLLCGST
jgi:hypothetical protein